VKSGEFDRCAPDEVADRALALIDGYGIRALIGDSAIPLEHARRAIAAALARELGLGERLVPTQRAGETGGGPARRARLERRAGGL
jgi:hypothetical protein